MGLSGLGYILDGWLEGTVGFSPTEDFLGTIAQVSIGVWIIWLLIVAWRMKESVQAAPA